MKTLTDKKDFRGIVVYWTPNNIAYQRVFPGEAGDTQIQHTEYCLSLKQIRFQIPGLKMIRWMTKW